MGGRNCPFPVGRRLPSIPVRRGLFSISVMRKWPSIPIRKALPSILFPEPLSYTGSFLWEWLHVGLEPLWWRNSSSFLWRHSSFLTAYYCKISTCSLNISISLSLLEWDGPTMLVADLSSCRWEVDFQLLVCEGCPWFFLWTLYRKHLSSWIDSLEMLRREKLASPLRDWFAMFFSKKNF